MEVVATLFGMQIRPILVYRIGDRHHGAAKRVFELHPARRDILAISRGGIDKNEMRKNLRALRTIESRRRLPYSGKIHRHLTYIKEIGLELERRIKLSGNTGHIRESALRQRYGSIGVNQDAAGKQLSDFRISKALNRLIA